MVAVDFQKAYSSVFFQFMRVALGYIGLRALYILLPLSIVEGPILFSAAKGFGQGLHFQICSILRQGDLLCFLLLQVVSIFLIYYYGRLRYEIRVVFYADDILIYIPRGTRLHENDLHAVLHVFIIFRFYSGLKVNYSKRRTATTGVYGWHHREGVGEMSRSFAFAMCRDNKPMDNR